MTRSSTLLQQSYKTVKVPPSISAVMPENAGVSAQVKSFLDPAIVRWFEPRQRDALIDCVVEVWLVGGDRPILRRPGPSADLYLLIDGWAYRASTLADGARQITDILLPGDLFELSPCSSSEPGQEIRASGPAQIARLGKDATGPEGALRNRWKQACENETRNLRSRLVSIGRRRSFERVAYFFAEIHERLSRIDLADGGAFACPLTQEQLGDALGLTAVHVNRVLHKLREDRLVTFNRPNAFIHDLARLHAAAGFAAGSIMRIQRG